ncbi:MAG: metal-sulfur cluster assembly factor [Firmicutes bacterium]|nr:metal-sulfur cluster assembly factor [Bacillota bacterium]
MSLPVTEEQVREALKQVKDPELGFDVVNLGLVYGVRIDGDRVEVEMTLTTPACPAGPLIVEEAKQVIERVEGVREAEVRLVFEPRWTEDRMSEELKLMRRWGMFG